MNVDQLKAINGQIKSRKKALSKSTIVHVSEKLRFSSETDPLFLIEVNIFVHEIHRILSKADYYDQIEKDLNDVCILAMNLSENLKITQQKNKALSKSLITDIKTIGRILAKIAPYIRMVSGVIILLNNSDVKFG